MATDVVAHALHICEEYGIDREILAEYDIVPRSARIWGGALRVRTLDHVIYLKHYRGGTERLQRTWELAERLLAQGIGVPRFLANKYGDTFVTHESGDVYAMAECPGRHPNLERESVFVRMCGNLGAFHTAAKSSPGTLSDIPRIDLVQRFTEVTQRLEQYRERALWKDEPTEFDELYLRVREEVTVQIQQSLRQLGISAYAEETKKAYLRGDVCHGSFTAQNLVLADGHVAILDLDHLFQGCQMLDLASYLDRHASRFSWDADLGGQALRMYESMRPTTIAERDVLGALLLYPEGIVRVVTRFYDGSGWDEEDALDALEEELEYNSMRIVFIRSVWGSLPDAAPIDVDMQESSYTEVEENTTPALDEEAGVRRGSTRGWRRRSVSARGLWRPPDPS